MRRMGEANIAIIEELTRVNKQAIIQNFQNIREWTGRVMAMMHSNVPLPPIPRMITGAENERIAEVAVDNQVVQAVQPQLN